MAELELQTNMEFDWARVLTPEGKEEPRVYGPNNTGMINIGNSCYIASTMQVLMSTSPFREIYDAPGQDHMKTCGRQVNAECFQCQMAKLAHGLYSGRYNPEPPTDMDTDHSEAQDSKEQRTAVQKASGVRPTMFKRIVTRDHPEFSSKRQQDAGEFLTFILDRFETEERKAGRDPTQQFHFELETRIECTQCGCVRYNVQDEHAVRLGVPLDKAVATEPPAEAKGATATASKPAADAAATSQAASAEQSEADQKKAKEKAVEAQNRSQYEEEKSRMSLQFKDCMDTWGEPQMLDYSCAQCKTRTAAKQTQRFKTFPSTLIAQVNRFVHNEWVPRKLGVDIKVPDRSDFSYLEGTGLQAGEQEMPEAVVEQPQANPDTVQQLEAMGFGHNRSVRAVLAVQNATADQAMNWLLSHMDDAGLDDPLPGPGAAAPAGPDPAAVMQIVSMGFDEARAGYALKKCNGNVEQAMEWIFGHMDEPIPMDGADEPSASEQKAAPDTRPPNYKLTAFITHLGPSTQRGHYVAHILRDGQWIHYNDAKVAISATPPKGQAYVYFFSKV